MTSVTGLICEPLPGRLSIPYERNDASRQAQGLVGWWPMVGAKTGYLPGLAARGVPLRSTNAAPLVADAVLGQAMTFNGSQSITGPDLTIPIFQQTTPFSACFWFASTDTLGSIINCFGYFGTAGWYIELNAGYLKINLTDNTLGGRREARTTATTFGDGALYHAAFTFSGNSNASGLQIYINGQPQAMTIITNTSPGTLATSRIEIATGLNTYSGRLADIRVYDRQLSAQECWELYAPQTRWELYRPLFLPPYLVPTTTDVIAAPGAVALALAYPSLTPIIQAQPPAVALTQAEPAVTPVVRPLPPAVALTTSVLSPTPVLQATPGAVVLALGALAATPIVQTQPSTVALVEAVLAATPVVQALPATVPLNLALPAVSIPRTITGGVVALSLSVLAPTPVVQPLPSVVALAVALPNETPIVQALPNAVALSLATQAPLPIVQVLPNAVALVISLPTPTIQIDSGTIVSPSVVALTLAALAPTPILQAQASTIALALSTLSPIPTLQAQTAAVALALSLLSPTQSIQARPDAVALVLSALATTPNVQVHPSVVALLLSLPTPTILITADVIATPSAIALLLSILDPTIQIVVPPAAVAGLIIRAPIRPFVLNVYGRRIQVSATTRAFIVRANPHLLHEDEIP